MKYLVKVTEFYRVDSEAEVKQLDEDSKKDGGQVIEFLSQYKERKQKGEVIDAWYRVKITKEFTKEKEPETQVSIKYNKESAF